MPADVRVEASDAANCGDCRRFEQFKFEFRHDTGFSYDPLHLLAQARRWRDEATAAQDPMDRQCYLRLADEWEALVQRSVETPAVLDRREIPVWREYRRYGGGSEERGRRHGPGSRPKPRAVTPPARSDPVTPG
jgi:hypothetical protein